VTPHNHDLESGATERESPAAPSKRKLAWWQETVLMLSLALLLSIVLKTFFVSAFYIPSPSMKPGFQINDRIMVQKVSYWAGTPQRGDIVVFKDPDHWLGAGAAVGPSNPVAVALGKVGLYPLGGHLVKRVIGVEGDVIECCDDQGRILVNGEPLDEQKYLAQGLGDCNGPQGGENCNWKSDPVPKGHLFVMGDNRYESADSSAHMCRQSATDCVPGREFVPVSSVVGKVFILLWPVSHFDWVNRPDNFETVPDP
jgi:signal peptidase I